MINIIAVWVEGSLRSWGFGKTVWFMKRKRIL